jgi:hypothetical protein
VHAWPVLRDAQKRAVSACCSAGLQLVWGPPGTGKTFVIAAAISHLVASGQRVLLVSNNNIAVDTALYEALSILRTTGEGQAIRVGNIGLPALVSDRRVRLDQLVEARQAQQRARVEGLARKLEELVRASVHLNKSERGLIGFDADRYRQAAARLAKGRRRGDVMFTMDGPGTPSGTPLRPQRPARRPSSCVPPHGTTSRPRANAAGARPTTPAERTHL